VQFLGFNPDRRGASSHAQKVSPDFVIRASSFLRLALLEEKRGGDHSDRRRIPLTI